MDQGPVKYTKKFIGQFLLARSGHFDSTRPYILSTFSFRDKIFCFYYVKKRFALGLLILTNDNAKYFWRSSNPIWETDKPLQPIKIELKSEHFVFYYKYKNAKDPQRIKFSFDKIFGHAQSIPIFLERTLSNPILGPHNIATNIMTSAAFNAAALHFNNKFHLIYRSILSSGESVFGYAQSFDGIRIDSYTQNPAFIHDEEFKYFDKIRFKYASGGGWSGCEDPRLTKIDDTIYMTYTAFNGYSAPAIFVTSIKSDQFEDIGVKEGLWSEPIQISPPNEMHKNWVLFPEKINGKFAILHSITPKIQIDYFDSLSGKNICIKSHFSQEKRDQSWDNYVRGVGPPPIKTDDGWLVFYHAMDCRDPNKYKIGALILDLNNPTRVKYRSSHPILEPKEHYEFYGYKPGVVYSCGALVKDEILYLYYGATDTSVCCATQNLKKFLHYIKTSQPVYFNLSTRQGNHVQKS